MLALSCVGRIDDEVVTNIAAPEDPAQLVHAPQYRVDVAIKGGNERGIGKRIWREATINRYLIQRVIQAHRALQFRRVLRWSDNHPRRHYEERRTRVQFDLRGYRSIRDVVKPSIMISKI